MVEQKHIDYWKAQQAKHATQLEAWERVAWADAKAVAKSLVTQFHATKVIVFGSLVRNRFQEDSDIDIAAEGIADEDFFSAIAAANSHSKRWIDLKPIESLDPRFKERVLATGKVIYEND